MTTRAKKCETFCLQSFFSYSRNQIFFLSPCLSQVIERKIAGILFRGITNGSEITHCQSIKGVHLKMLQFIVQVFTVCSRWIPRVSFKRRLFIHFSVHPLVNNVFLENCNFLHGYNSIKMTRQVFSQKIINTKIKIIIKKLFDKRSNYESKMACLVCFFGTILFFTGISCAWLGWIWSNVFTLNFAKWASKLSETENR